MTCPKCAAEAGPDEKFCAACGASLMADPPAGDAPVAGAPIVEAPAELPPAMMGSPRWENAAKINKARKWLLAVAVLTCLFGFYFVNMQEVERQIRVAKAQIHGLDPAEVDARFMQAVGMTFQEAIDHDR